MIYVIYTITNEATEKMYIGKSQEFDKRRRSHINMLRQNKHNNYYLQNDWNEFGEDMFSFNILYSFNTKNEAEEKEMELVNSMDADSIYNIVKDKSVGGNTFTHNPRKEEIRMLKSINSSGSNNPMYGKPKSELMINRVKEANSKAVIIEGVEFPSITEAANFHEIKNSTAQYRVSSKSERFKNWVYK